MRGGQTVREEARWCGGSAGREAEPLGDKCTGLVSQVITRVMLTFRGDVFT